MFELPKAGSYSNKLQVAEMPSMRKISQHPFTFGRNCERVNEDKKEAPKRQEVNDKIKELISTDITTKKPIHRILPTTIVEIVGKNGQMHQCNVLLDSDSQFNFTTHLCSKLELRTVKADISIAGINQIETKVLETTKEIIKFMHSDFKEKFMFIIISKITARLLSKPLKFQKTDIPPDIPFADLNFYKLKKIDLLIRIKLFWDLIYYKPSEYSYLCKTKLGYIIAENLPRQSNY